MAGKSQECLQAGFASIDITPADSLPMGGYMARTEPAKGAHDPLCAKAVALRYGRTSAILVSLDVVYVSHEWCRGLRDAISRKIGSPRDNVIVAATHNHSGPAVFSPMRERAEQIARYEEELFDSCLEVAERALSSLEDSLMRVRYGLSEGIAGNRRNPPGIRDDCVSVVRLESFAGEAIGHLVSFACHPTVMSPSNLEYSSDLFGASAREVEKEFKDSTCVIFNGAAADSSTRFTRKEQTWTELDRLGSKLARKIMEASRTSQVIESGPITARTAIRTVPFREIPDVKEAQRQFDQASRKYRNATTVPDEEFEAAEISRSIIEGAAVQLFLSKVGGWESLFGTAAAEVELQVIRIGDLIICGLPGEFFGARGVLLKEAAEPMFGFIVGYANGYWGYAVPPEEASKGGYECMTASLRPNDEAKIIQEAAALIREIKKLPR